MDAVTAINHRIAEIQARIAVVGQSTLARTGVAAGSTFADVLGSVQSATSTSVNGTAGVSDVGSGAALVDSDGVPIAFKTYGNGRIPTSELSQIEGTSAQLWAPAARSFEALRSAAEADGVTIGITDSYRTYDAQVDVAARKGLYSQGGLAAVPGTSRHGWGMAVDLRLDSSAQTWMREHGDEYGFVEAVPRESWHWEYQPTH